MNAIQQRLEICGPCSSRAGQFCVRSSLQCLNHAAKNDCVEFRVKGVIRAERPRATIAQAATFGVAALVGRYVDEQVRLDREAICATCPFSRVDSDGVRWCSVCGCGTSNAERQIRNLAAYEENLPHWGCKHPQRAKGQGWKK